MTPASDRPANFLWLTRVTWSLWFRIAGGGCESHETISVLCAPLEYDGASDTDEGEQVLGVSCRVPVSCPELQEKLVVYRSGRSGDHSRTRIKGE